LASAYRLGIARFVKKFNLQFRIVKKLNQEDKKVGYCDTSKHATGFHRTLKFSALENGFVSKAIGWVLV